ncbi:MAG: hypothetical protein ACK5L5_09875, partial [Bacteroidales bacterium]
LLVMQSEASRSNDAGLRLLSFALRYLSRKGNSPANALVTEILLSCAFLFLSPTVQFSAN